MTRSVVAMAALVLLIGCGSVPSASDDPATSDTAATTTDATNVVASYTGGIAGVGVGGTLAPGESSEIPVLVGTASCGPGVGYALPPGQYDVLVPVVVLYPQRAGDPTVNQLVTRPAALTVVP